MDTFHKFIILWDNTESEMSAVLEWSTSNAGLSSYSIIDMPKLVVNVRDPKLAIIFKLKFGKYIKEHRYCA